MVMYTTLDKIRAHHPCAEGWRKLLQHLGKVVPDDKPVAIATILDSNGIDDALWCLRAVDGSDRELRLYVVWCARQVQHLMNDPRSSNVLDVAERYANGHATDEELAAARRAAVEAAREVTVSPAEEAAMEAAWTTAGAAAGAAAVAVSAAAAWATAWEKTGAVNKEWNVVRNAARSAHAAKLREICE
jgi:hypothetical protein